MYFFDPACQSGCVRCYSGFASINLYCEFFDEISLLIVKTTVSIMTIQDTQKAVEEGSKAQMIVNLLTFTKIMLHPFGKMHGLQIGLL